MRTGHLLAIDSSTETLCLAACGPDRSAVWAAAGGPRASALLLTQAQALLRELGLNLARLDGIAYASGPGAFTGLRTACAAAQGLALGLGCQVLPVDSLMVVAEAERLRTASIQPALADLAVVMDARMGEVYAGRFAWRSSMWQTLSAPALWRPDDLLQAWHAAPPKGWVGTGLLCLGQVMAPALATAEADIQRAQALLSLAQSLWQHEAGLHPRDAHPLYLRDKVALTTAERSANLA